MALRRAGRERSQAASRLGAVVVVVVLPSGAVYRSAANDASEAADLLMAAGWINWDAAAGVS